jgi:hypothetical protein
MSTKRPETITKAKVERFVKGVIAGGIPSERITRVVGNTITGDITVIATPDSEPIDSTPTDEVSLW